MAKQSPGKVYQDLRAAGFSPTRAVIMTAIAGAESGWDDTARGDLGLQDNTWGPSYGLFQVRTLKGQTGSGQDRDVSWLAQSDANQAKAAYDISHGGTDFSPWSTYNTGKYQQFLGQAQSGTTDVQPVGLLGGSSITGGIRDLVVQVAFAGLGLALVGLGVARAVKR